MYWIRKFVIRTLKFVSMLVSKALIAAIGLFFISVGLSLIPKVESYGFLNKIISFDTKLRAPLMKWIHANLPVNFEGFDAAPWLYITTLFLALVAIEFYRDRNFEQDEVLRFKRKDQLDKIKSTKKVSEKAQKRKDKIKDLEKEAKIREEERKKIEKEQEALYQTQRDAIAAAQRATQEKATRDRANVEAREAEERAVKAKKAAEDAEKRAIEDAKREAEEAKNAAENQKKETDEAAKRELEEAKREAQEAKQAAETAIREAEEAKKKAAESATRAATEAKAAEVARQEALEAKKKEAPTMNKREELLELLAQTKKSLDEQKRDCAFLAMDVVNSTGMKQGEDPAIAARDFKQYKKHVMEALQAHNFLKLAWTPDGQMICFDSVDDAIKAGQAVLSGLKSFNKDIKAMKMDFKIRAGINAGRVLYDEETPMEEMSDRVIDIAGHMQKYAPADSIFINSEILGDRAETYKFSPDEKIVDDCSVMVWHVPSPEDDPKKDAVAA